MCGSATARRRLLKGHIEKLDRLKEPRGLNYVQLVAVPLPMVLRHKRAPIVITELNKDSLQSLILKKVVVNSAGIPLTRRIPAFSSCAASETINVGPSVNRWMCMRFF